MVYRSYRYRLYPTVGQERTLVETLARLCELYNAALQERRDAWNRFGKSVQLYDQQSTLPEVRFLRPEYGLIAISVMRGALRRLDRAFQAFFRRCKSGETPGFPRFCNARRYNTIEIDSILAHPIVAGGKRISVPLVGKIRFKQHRPLGGTPKSIRITHDNGRWWVVIQCTDVPVKPLPILTNDVGIDLGLKSLIVTSDGETFENPRVLKQAQVELARAQRRVSRRKKRSKRRGKAIRVLRRKHQRVANVRREYAIKVACFLVGKYGVIYHENLNIIGLAGGMFAKSVHDAGWGISLHWLNTKAEEAGRSVVAVNPSGTSINCSKCGERVPKELSERTHRCQNCGLVLCRDVNAARNIKALGRSARGGSAGSQPPTIRVGTRRRGSGVGTTAVSK